MGPCIPCCMGPMGPIRPMGPMRPTGPMGAMRRMGPSGRVGSPVACGAVAPSRESIFRNLT